MYHARQSPIIQPKPYNPCIIQSCIIHQNNIRGVHANIILTTRANIVYHYVSQANIKR